MPASLKLEKSSAWVDGNGDSLPNVGEQVEYQFTITNDGDEAIDGIVVSDPLATVTTAIAGGGTFDGRLAPGQQVVLLGSYALMQAAIDAGEVRGRASISGRASGTSGVTVSAVSNEDVEPLARTFGLDVNKVPGAINDLDGNGHDAGDQVVYNYRVANNGNTRLFNIELVDDNGTFINFQDDVIVSLLGLTDEDGDGQADDLAVGGSATGSYIGTLSQAAVDAGQLRNIAMVSADNTAGEVEEQLTSARVRIEREPEITLVKTTTNADIRTLGEAINYDYSVTNSGNISLLNVTLSDDNGTPNDGGDDVLLSLVGLSDLDGDGDADDLAAGATATANYVGLATQTFLDAGGVTNQAITTGRGTNNQTVTDQDFVTVPALATPEIAATKAIAPSNQAQRAGDPVPYRYSLTNTGNVSLLNVQLLDDNGTPNDPSDDVIVAPLTGLTDLDNDGDADDLAVGATATGSYIGTLTQAAIDAGELTNIVIGSGTSPQGERVEQQATATLTIAPNPSIAVAKAIAPGTTVSQAGDAVPYGYSLTNRGNVSLLNVQLLDDNGTPNDPADDVIVMPLTGLSDLDNDGDADDLAVDATATGTYVGTIGQDAIDAGSLTNIVVGSGTSPSGTTVTAEDSATIMAPADPGLTVTKTIADILDNNGNAAKDLEDSVVYNYSLTNSGNVSLLNVSLVDDNGTPGNLLDDVTITPLAGLSDLDNDGEADDLAVNATATGTYTGSITQAAMDAGELTNVVVGQGTSPQGETITDEARATVTPDAAPALTVVKTVAEVIDNNGNAVNDAGDGVLYNYSLTNSGNVSLLNVSLVDDNGTPGDLSDDVAVTPLTDLSDLDNDGESDDLAVGATATGAYRGSITQAAVDAGELTNVVVGRGTSPTGEPVEAEDTATVETVLPNPSLALTKLTSSDGINFLAPTAVTEAVEVAAGAAVYWRYEVTNTGNIAFAQADLVLRDDNGTPGDSADDFNGVLDLTSDLNGNGKLDVGETWIYNASAIAQDLSFGFDFDSEHQFAAGDAAATINAAYADLEISTANVPGLDDTINRIMIFNTANPTGGDADLGTPSPSSGIGSGVGTGTSSANSIGNGSGNGFGNSVAQGNVLIISEDGDGSDPDDNADGGTINLAWTNGPVRLTSLGLLDIDVDEKSVMAQTALAGTVLGNYDAQNLGNNSHQTLSLGGEWADQLAVNFVHSGAITGFTGIGVYSNQATVSVNFNGTAVEASAESYYTNSIPSLMPSVPAVPSVPVAGMEVVGAVAIPELPNRQEPDPETTAPEALFVVGYEGNGHDELLQQQLRDRGFNLTVVDDEIVTPNDGSGMDLILISESVLSGNVGDTFTQSSATVLTWEAYLYDDLGMTGVQAEVDFGWTPGSSLVQGGDRLRVYEGSGHLSWALPGDEAITLATLGDNRDRAALFGYEAGALLPNGAEAAGKRVGFFAHGYAAPFSQAGLALFNTAVDYAMA